MNKWLPFKSIEDLQNGDLIKLDYEGYVDFNEGQDTTEICVIIDGKIFPINDVTSFYSILKDGTEDYANIIQYIPVLPRECKIDFSEHPNALPDGFVVKDSPIHGKGLFTTYRWPCNTRIITSHVKVRGNTLRNGTVGAYINHSDTPNCEIRWDGEVGDLFSLVAIAQGEELTLNYFEEECGKGVKRINCDSA